MVTYTIVLVAVLIAAIVWRKKLKGLVAVFLGAALAFGSLATPIGAPLSGAAQAIFQGVQSGGNGVINSVK